MAGLWSKPLIAVALVFIAITGIRGYVLEPTKVVSISMAPSLTEGDLLIVDKISPALFGVKPGDIVVVRNSEGNRIVKRVSAIAGQTFEIYDSRVIINEEEVPEPYVKAYNPSGLFHASLKVPEGEIFLLGDNRIHSLDSRTFGTLPVSSIIGKVVMAVPLGNRGEQPSASD